MDADMSWDGEPIKGMSDADAKLLAALTEQLIASSATAIPAAVRRATSIGSESRPATKLWCHSSLIA